MAECVVSPFYKPKSLIKVLSGSVASGTVHKLVPTFGVASGSVLAVFGIPGVWLFVFIFM